MRIVLAIIVLSIVMTGCVGVDGEPIAIQDMGKVYDGGFLDGCMSAILMLSTPQDLPTYEHALEVCGRIRAEAGVGELGDMPSEMSTPTSKPTREPVVCDGNCI